MFKFQTLRTEQKDSQVEGHSTLLKFVNSLPRQWRSPRTLNYKMAFFPYTLHVYFPTFAAYFNLYVIKTAESVGFPFQKSCYTLHFSEVLGYGITNQCPLPSK